jgi:hypothetical protein
MILSSTVLIFMDKYIINVSFSLTSFGRSPPESSLVASNSASWSALRWPASIDANRLSKKNKRGNDELTSKFQNDTLNTE